MADFHRHEAGTATVPSDNEKSRLDDAARAGWLYFVAGHTQDEIAKRLKVSRATAQRLVSLCLSEKLIIFRLEHPIAACMELARRLMDRFGLWTLRRRADGSGLGHGGRRHRRAGGKPP